MATGIGLVEVYDVDPSANAQPTNLSARAFVGTGNDVLIGVPSSGGTAQVCSVSSCMRLVHRLPAPE
jgi:hypothetical protein